MALTLRQYATDRSSRGLQPSSYYSLWAAVRDGRLRECVLRRGKSILITDSAAADAELLANTLATDRWSSPTSAASTLAEHRARKDAAKAQLLELELAVKRGEMVPLDTVAAEWFAQGRQIRDRLQGIPARVVDQLAVLLGVEAGPLRLIVEQEIDQALLKVSQSLRGYRHPSSRG